MRTWSLYFGDTVGEKLFTALFLLITFSLLFSSQILSVVGLYQLAMDPAWSDYKFYTSPGFLPFTVVTGLFCLIFALHIYVHPRIPLERDASGAAVYHYAESVTSLRYSLLGGAIAVAIAAVLVVGMQRAYTAIDGIDTHGLPVSVAVTKTEIKSFVYPIPVAIHLNPWNEHHQVMILRHGKDPGYLDGSSYGNKVVDGVWTFHSYSFAANQRVSIQSGTHALFLRTRRERHGFDFTIVPEHLATAKAIMLSRLTPPFRIPLATPYVLGALAILLVGAYIYIFYYRPDQFRAALQRRRKRKDARAATKAERAAQQQITDTKHRHAREVRTLGKKFEASKQELVRLQNNLQQDLQAGPASTAVAALSSNKWLSSARFLVDMKRINTNMVAVNEQMELMRQYAAGMKEVLSYQNDILSEQERQKYIQELTALEMQLKIEDAKGGIVSAKALQKNSQQQRLDALLLIERYQVKLAAVNYNTSRLERLIDQGANAQQIEKLITDILQEHSTTAAPAAASKPVEQLFVIADPGADDRTVAVSVLSQIKGKLQTGDPGTDTKRWSQLRTQLVANLGAARGATVYDLIQRMMVVDE